MSPDATAPDLFTAPEAREISRSLREHGSAACPRCGAALDERAVPPRGDVSYVRDRIWLVCPRCHGQVVVDRREA